MMPRLNGARRAVVALLMAAALAAGLAACRNPFLPAQPEPPGSATEDVTVAMEFSRPALLFNTLVTAIAVKNRGNGVAAYIGAFADTTTQGVDMHVEFDPAVVAERAGVGERVPSWLRSDEIDFYRYLSGLAEGDYSLLLSPVLTDNTDDPNHQFFNREYTLTSTTQDGNSTELARGWAEIELRYVTDPSAQWVITRWTDHVIAGIDPNPSNPGQRSFSRLRFDSYTR